MARIPLLVLGGFLGAGKTTLLNRLLTQTAGRRVAVLVNDFGAINVDAALIRQHDGETISLANGCICCSIGSGLDDALMRVLERNPLPELIVIECSGVSDPGLVAQVGVSDPMLQLEGVVVLVDAGQVALQLADPLLSDTLERQIGAAGLLVLNKVDLVDAAGLDACKSLLSDRFGPMAMVEAVEADVADDLLAWVFGGDAAARHADARPAHAGRAHDDHGAAPDHPFESGVWRSADVLEADALSSALKRLPRSVLRVKGEVVTDRHGRAIVHLAGGRVRFQKLPQSIQSSAASAASAGNELVYIGMRGADIHRVVDDALHGLTAGASAG